MKQFKSYSQAGQDRFVVAVLNSKRDGTFLDIGCCHPTELSNTYALENEFGWRGLLVDSDPGAVRLCREQRQSRVIEADATKIDWKAEIGTIDGRCPYSQLLVVDTTAPFQVRIDYMSLDVDAASLATLLSIPLRWVKLGIITIEHDSYRFGPEPRDAMREYLKANDYDLVCADVQSADGIPYEDWWVAPNLSVAANRFRCSGKKWTEIFPT